MEFESFLVSLGTSAVIFVVLMLLFTWLSRRPGNVSVYYPNRILKGMDPWEGSSLTRNPFAWIREAFTSTEQDVVKLSGVDTAVYFVFLSTVLGIFALSALLLLPTLLPISATDNSLKNSRSATDTTSNGTFSQLDNLSMANITKKSSRLWAFLGAVYWVSLVTYFMLWKAYKHVAALRAEALMSSEEVLPEQYAILVRDIPSPPNGETQKEFVDSYFREIYPETFYRSLVVTENSKVINKIWEDLEGYKKKLARAEAVFAATSNRPTNKTGLLGLVGERVDSIDYYTKLINESVTKLEAEQRKVLAEKQQTAAVVFFTDRVTAALAAQSLHCQMVDKWTVTEAPEPRQLIWENLKIKFFSRIVRQYLIYFLVAITILFYMIPIAFVSAITTLGNLQKALPFIKPIAEIAFIRTILQSYLPQIALIVFLAMLPKFLMFLSKSEGIPSQSHAIRAASGKYFYFSVLNVFIGVTLAGSLFDNLKALEKKPNSIITVLATSLPKNATFFLTYVALKFFVGYGLELSRIIPLIIFHLKKKYLCKTEAEVKEAWYPGDLSYATRVPSDMLILTITFCYSVIAPLILVFGVIYFGLGWLILRNQALKVYVPSYESYGRMWPHIHTRILAALFLFQLVMFGYLGVKLFVWATLLVPLIFISLIFGYVCRQKFYKGFEHTALEVACRELKQRPDLEEVFKAYIPHSLSTHKGDDHQFKGAMSRYQDYAAISAA
uniref:CSC1-like protein ERD4 n=1 Tax=Brassica oleracea TaxID=3712 RepID=A0A3P6BCD6_BRAOL|nr:unnamed protein product [Brassica oleracea]